MSPTALLFMALIGVPGTVVGLILYGKGGAALFGGGGAILGLVLWFLVEEWLPDKLDDWVVTALTALFIIIPVVILIWTAATYIVSNWGVY